MLLEEDIERLARVEANKQQIYRSNSCCSPSRGMLLEVSESPTTTGGIVFAAIAWLLLFAAIAWPFVLAGSAT
ncbi:hypothetical protein BST44_26950 [Mycobacterium scrofulaceum]|uniref:Uncharacterized protein n=1 Tax=Mycobacterium scrofulaceum TaxID=1783 RepID=A0A1X0JZZ7_MYCSC|nr:hypothetical protein BST44_26950 [Mycobacterium scrofulaceum]